METTILIQDVRNVNNKVKANNKSLGGCISNILNLDFKGLEKQEKNIINGLLACKKSPKNYKLLADKVKPHFKSGNYNNYSVILGVKAIYNKLDLSVLVEKPAETPAKKPAKKPATKK